MTYDLFGCGQFIGNLATAGALIALVVQTYLNKKQIRLTKGQVDLTMKQVDQAQQQIDAKFRPWIGNVDEKSPWYRGWRISTGSIPGPGWWDRIDVYVKNYGDIPYTSCQWRGIITALAYTFNALAYTSALAYTINVLH